ncbi:permease [Chitinispirillales bacterium ANBcel5]|uniref:permease n=1 Tax=Cellulosispirillum alkaliphilum TaxID=3039283 RepID=UPI002A52DEDE|nr:permease [Chitinispirillales bacterium ANBcel5]
MDWKKEFKPLLLIVTVFLAVFYMPVGTPRFDNAVYEALALVRYYAREHVILCLIPAFFIAGAIGVFISQASVMKYLGAGANKFLSYGVASVSGTVLAVCSCTILPLFAGIYKMGAGIGAATAFLYAGPAINVLAIVLTARVLGPQMGIARAVGAVVFSIVIGLCMHCIYRKEEAVKAANQVAMPQEENTRPLWKTAAYFFVMIAVLVFANWGQPMQETGIWNVIYQNKWIVTTVFALIFGIILITWFKLEWWKLAAAAVPAAIIAALAPRFIVSEFQPVAAFAAASVGFSAVISTEKGEIGEWFSSTWIFAKQIMPLLLFGVLVAGFLLGRVGNEGIIPSEWVSAAVGGNSFRAVFFASIAGAFMYFATLTEVPILQGLIGNGMGQGPALALLLAGPALSLPSMLVLYGVMGLKKLITFIILVVIMATTSGMIYGNFFG